MSSSREFFMSINVKSTLVSEQPAFGFSSGPAASEGRSVVREPGAGGRTPPERQNQLSATEGGRLNIGNFPRPLLRTSKDRLLPRFLPLSAAQGSIHEVETGTDLNTVKQRFTNIWPHDTKSPKHWHEFSSLQSVGQFNGFWTKQSFY